MKNEFWMSNLDTLSISRPLNFLAIPGSHDSFTCDISKTSEIGPDVRDASLKLIKNIGYYGKCILKPWLITQILNPIEQLVNGVRYFDLRIGKSNSENIELLITHQLFSGKLDGYLQQILEFLNDHPKEIVLLDFNHIYLEENEHELLSDLIIEVFGEKIAPFCDHHQIPNLNDLWERKQQVLIFYHFSSTINERFWPKDIIPSFWPNTTDTKVMTDYLQNSLNEKDDNKFHISQGILTPNWKTIAFHPLSSLEYHLANKANNSVLKWLDNLNKSEKSVLNILIVDFIDDLIIEKIVKFNKNR